MEEFSQSRGDDDLFSDEITPLQPLQQNPLSEQVQQLSIQPQEQSEPRDRSQPTSLPFRGDQDRGRGRGRGRARARGNAPPRGSGGLHDSKFAPKSNSKPKPAPEASKEANIASEAGAAPSSLPLPGITEQVMTDVPAASEELDKPPVDTTQEKAPPTGPAQPTNRTPAVRGDRTATGGVPKPKLTKEELDAKLAAAKEKSKALSEKHAKAQADAADFEERERIAKQKRQEEVVERRKLEGERERNRARKLQAVGGREWDAEKNEDDFRQPRYGQSIRRGPADEQQDLSIYEWRDDPEGQDEHGYCRGRGRGRGRVRGRGRGADQRGGRGNGFMGGPTSKFATEQAKTPTADDFPALPSNKETNSVATQGQRPPVQQRKDSDMTPAGSWADQMAS